MEIGMLWFDNDSKRTMEQKIKLASDFFTKKYSKEANKCVVHPVQFVELDWITVLSSKFIRINHIWIGVDNA